MVLKAVEELPDDSSIDDIADKIDFMAAVQAGIDEIDAGAGISHSDLKKELASWLTS